MSATGVHLILFTIANKHLAPWNVQLPQEPHHDSPPHASQDEEPFEIELVVPRSQAAQGAPAEEQR
jgi:hypothetical protein